MDMTSKAKENGSTAMTNDGGANASKPQPSAEAPSQLVRDHEDPSLHLHNHQDTTMNALLSSNDNANVEQVEVAQESEVRDTRISFEVHPQNFDGDDAIPDDISDQQQLNVLGNASGNAAIDVLRLVLFGVR